MKLFMIKPYNRFNVKNPMVFEGYYKDGSFYTDPGYQYEITPTDLYKYYISLDNYNIYEWVNGAFNNLTSTTTAPDNYVELKGGLVEIIDEVINNE